MAFRHAAMRLGAGGAGAAVAGPSASHCYSRPSARPVGTRTEEGWVLPQILDNEQILFSEEEVSSTVNLFLGLPEGSKPASTVVTEVDGSDDDSSVGTAANFSIEEADRDVVRRQDLQQNFGRTLQGLLSNREVQQACVNALREDPAFSDMVAQLPQAGSTTGHQMELANLLPPAARIVEDGQPSMGSNLEDPFKDFLDDLAARARGVGEKIKSTWDSVGNSVGQAIIRFGLAIHGILGRPFQPEPAYPEQAEWEREVGKDVDQGQPPSWFQNPDAVGKVVIKVACVIVALMVFKRVVRV